MGADEVGLCPRVGEGDPHELLGLLEEGEVLLYFLLEVVLKVGVQGLVVGVDDISDVLRALDGVGGLFEELLHVAVEVDVPFGELAVEVVGVVLGVGVQLPAGYFLSLLLYSLLVGVAAVAIVLDLGLGVVIEGAGGFSFQSFSVFFHDYYYRWCNSSKSIGGKISHGRLAAKRGF